MAVRTEWLPRSQAAAPSASLLALWNLIENGRLIAEAWASLERIFIGVPLGTAAGVGTGALLARSSVLKRLFGPTLQVLAPIPVIIWYPFALMLLGMGNVHKIALVFLATYFLIHIEASDATEALSKKYEEVADVYDIEGLRFFWHIVLPGIAERIGTQLRISLAISWIVLFIVEYGSKQMGGGGLGAFIMTQNALGRMEQVFAGVFVLGLAAYLLDEAVKQGREMLIKWEE